MVIESTKQLRTLTLCVKHTCMRSMPTLGGLGAYPLAGNFENLHSLRLNLRTFLVFNSPSKQAYILERKCPNFH